MVSIFHETMIETLRKGLPYKVVGYPNKEINLGSFTGLANTSLYADAFIEVDKKRMLVVEFQSILHTDKSKGAWGDELGHLRRSSNDDLKKVICSMAGIGLLELWPGKSHDKTDYKALLYQTEQKIEELAEVEEWLLDLISAREASRECSKLKSLPFNWEPKKMGNGKGFKTGRKFRK